MQKMSLITNNRVFFASFVVPPELPTDSLLNGKKFLVAGCKGVGKTSVLYYLQNMAQERDSSTCSSFIYFKSEFEEVRRSNMETISLSSLSVMVQASQTSGISAETSATFDRVAKSDSAFRSLIDIVDECEQLFKELIRTDIPYYIFSMKWKLIVMTWIYLNAILL